MGNALQVDGSAGDAYVEVDFPTQAAVHVTFKLALSAIGLAFWTDPGSGNLGQFIALPSPDADEGFADGLSIADIVDWGEYWLGFYDSGSVPAPVAEQCLRCEFRFENNVISEFKIDDVTVFTNDANPGLGNVNGFRLGVFTQFGSPPPGAIAYFTDVVIEDLFSDDFSSGNLSAWTTQVGDVSVVENPFPCPEPPPPPRIRTFIGAPWRIIVTSIAGRTLSDLDRKATGRQFLFTLNGPAYHTGQVASDDPEINIPFPDADSPSLLTHNRRLLYALRYEQGADPPYVCRFGGIITNFEDQGADTPTSRYTAYDPWQYLMSRPIRGPGTDLSLPGDEGITFPAGTRASDIAAFFLAATEAVDGETHIDFSDSGLIENTDPLTEAITFDAGLSVGEAWQQLVATGTIDIYLPPMYEPIDAPGKVVRFQTAKRLGETRFNVVMGWDTAGRSLQGVNRFIDGTRMANRVKYWAGQTPAPLESDAASIAAYGEWWAQQFFPGEANLGLVELMALAEMLIRRNGARSINLDPAPERTELVLRDYGLGDYLPVWASRNLREPLGIDYDAFDPDFPGASGYHRVFAIPVELDDNGTEMTRGIATASEQASG